MKRSAEQAVPNLDPFTKHKKLNIEEFCEDNLDVEDILKRNEEARKKWPRNPASLLDPEKDDFRFQQIDCDYTVMKKPYSSPKASQGHDPRSKIPVIRMFGCTSDGNSVLLNIYGFLPYFYIEVPPHSPLEIDDETLCKCLKSELEELVKQDVKSSDSVDQYVIDVSIVRKKSLMRYREHSSDFFKIVLALPKHVVVARTILENVGITLDIIGNKVYQTYESNIVFALRFTIDMDVTGMSWIHIPIGKWIHSPEHLSTCQYEIDCYFADLVPLSPDGEWIKIAPLRILSFDIECCGRENLFPIASIDPVIQIANIIKVHGSENELIRNVFVLGSCTPIVNADVRCFTTEAEMLLAWKDFILEADPDFIIGYNIVNFDIPYLFDRAKALNINNFPLMSRMGSNSQVKVKVGTFSSKAYGNSETKQITMFGRVFFDLLQVLYREVKLRSYTLNSVSAEFMGERKEDVPYSIISRLHNGTPDDRRRLAVYCLKDSYLPTRLLEKLSCLINYIELSRVAGVPFLYLLQRGQSIRVLSQLYRYAKREDLLVPFYKLDRTQPSITYEGASVIQPVNGFYDIPIITLDFASLYPSIMMAYNLCYSTLTSREAVQGMSPDEYIVTPANHFFVTDKKCKGILSKILETLINQRSHTKASMKEATDPAEIAALNARQMAFKILANSVYGFTGATVGSLPCLEISASVTAFGRQMIELTRQAIIDEFSIKNGYKFDASVIYGDTDSVMIKFGCKDLSEAMEYGAKAAKIVSEKFPNPISLEFEKVYDPFLLVSKKRYAGLIWTNPDKWDKLDAKGLESVRRDNCLLVKRVIDKCLGLILIDKNIDGAIEYCKSTVKDLLTNKLDISMLVITKALSKKEKDYKGKQAHVELNKKIERRSEGTSYHLGERIPFVIRKGSKGDITADKAEDPIYVLQNNIPIDTQFYVDMLSRPLVRIFSPILSNPEAILFQGPHMMEITVQTPKSGGIIGFTQIRPSCQGCKVCLKQEEKVLCSNCKEFAPYHYMKQLQVVRQKELEFSRLWIQCQNCQGSHHHEVLCRARDCPIFYMRTKVQVDLVNSQMKLDIFESID